MVPVRRAQIAAAGPHGSSGLAIFAALTLLILGIAGTIIFGVLLVLFDTVARLSFGVLVSLATVESTRIVLLTLLIAAVAHIVAAVGVFAHSSWARLVGLALSVPATIAGTLLLVGAASRGLRGEALIGGALVFAYALVFIGLIAGNSHFRRTTSRY